VVKEVGNFDYFVTCEQNIEIVTHNIGAGVAVSVYDPVAKIGGLVHCMLPISKVDPEQAKKYPCMFIDTGVTLLLAKLFDLGVTRSDLIVKVAGAGAFCQPNEVLNIGKRSFTVLKKVLTINKLQVLASDVCSDNARSMTLNTETGKTTVLCGCGKEIEL